MELRQRIGREEFDYQTLLHTLSEYASPRGRITVLLRRGVIVRIKKGLYVFGDAYRKGPYCRELLANLIYGPSFISLDYALGHYGLIPERVEAITSVTCGRKRRFETPVGLFLYHPTPCCSTGVDRLGEEASSFLIAVPERALADQLRSTRHIAGRTQRELERYLFEDLRMEISDVKTMDSVFMEHLAEVLKSRKIRTCSALIRNLRRRG